MRPIPFPLLPSAPAHRAVPRKSLVDHGATCLHGAKWWALRRPRLSAPWHLIGFPLYGQHELWPLLIIITFLETPACPSSRFISPHSLGDTILSTESVVAAAASLSSWLTPASPALGPVRDFKFKLNFNAGSFDVGGRTASSGGS